MRIWGLVFAWHAMILLAVVWAFYGLRFRAFQESVEGRDRMRPDFYVAGIEKEGLRADAEAYGVRTLRLQPL